MAWCLDSAVSGPQALGHEPLGAGASGQSFLGRSFWNVSYGVFVIKSFLDHQESPSWISQNPRESSWLLQNRSLASSWILQSTHWSSGIISYNHPESSSRSNQNHLNSKWFPRIPILILPEPSSRIIQNRQKSSKNISQVPPSPLEH